MSAAHGIRLRERRSFSREGRARLGRRHARLVAQAPPDDKAAEQCHQQEAWQEAREENADDRRIGRDRIDHHRDRRRDQDAERAGGCERAERDLFVVAALAQLRQRDLRDRRAGRRRRAAHRAEDAAAEHRGVHSRPGMRLSHGARPSNISSLSRLRNRISPIQMNSGSAASSQLALISQNAEIQVLARLRRREERLADPADDRQRHRDPHAAREQHQQHAAEQESSDPSGGRATDPPRSPCVSQGIGFKGRTRSRPSRGARAPGARRSARRRARRSRARRSAR